MTVTIPEQRTGEVPSQQALDVWALVQRVQDGDKEAFGAIYDRYVDTIYLFVYRRVSNRPLAEDLTSDTFLRALKRIHSYTWQGRDLGAWLVTIARNLIADYYKSGRFRLEVTTGDVLDADREDRSTEGSPETAVVDHLTNVQLLKAVLALNPEQRECIELRYLRGYSVAETAQAMGKNEGAIKALAYRATRSLARMFPLTVDSGLPEPMLQLHDGYAPPGVWEAAQIRAWAAEHGIKVGSVGFLARRVVEKYRAEVGS